MNYFNTGLIFTSEVFILCKKVWGQRSEAVNFNVPFFHFLRKMPDCLEGDAKRVLCSERIAILLP